MLHNDIKKIVKEIIERANESKAEAKESQDNFYLAKNLAYYEVLDMLRDELTMQGESLADYGLNFELESILVK